MTRLAVTILANILSLLLITGCFCPNPCCPYRPCPPIPCCDMKPGACPKSHCCAKPSSPQANGGQQQACCPEGNCQQIPFRNEVDEQNSCQQNGENSCQQNSCQQNNHNHCNHCYPYRDCPLDPNYHDLD